MVKYEDYDKAFTALEIWLKSQPHLPKIKPIVMKTFIQVCCGDLENTKSLIDTHYGLRNIYSHMFIDRDPTDKMSKIVSEVYENVIMPDFTPEGYSVQVNRLANPDPDMFYHTEMAKYMFMQFDAMLATPHPSGNISKGCIGIFDMSGFTFKHLTKYNMSTLKIFMKFTQEAAIVQIKQMHIINTLPIIDKLMTMVKPFMSAELTKTMHFHKPNSTTLFDFVSKKFVPVNFGGTGPSIEELKEIQNKDLLDKRSYLMDKSFWVIDESKRPQNQKRTEKLKGNFRSLNVD